ncbi:MAG TPA: aspartate/glutamate racemase family protein [Kofleriaceae bacterium]|nr:aspartate/glutamate racemase family protein [Kofleriaceae bacterium]
MIAGEVGILDWGIGGLGFFRELRALRPDVDVRYWSDTGAIPYGQLSRKALAARLCAVIARLAELGAGCVVIACNAASTAIRDLSPPIPVVGIIEPAIAHVVELKNQPRGPRTVGVVGGGRTIRSGIYRRHLVAAGLTVIQRIAQPLSGLVEAGQLSGPAVDAAMAAILAPLAGIDALLLACTHYPALAPRFRAHLPGVTLIDPAAALAAQVIDRWQLAPGNGRTTFMTTGDAAAMQRSAQAAFALHIPGQEVEPGGYWP